MIEPTSYVQGQGAPNQVNIVRAPGTPSDIQATTETFSGNHSGDEEVNTSDDESENAMSQTKTALSEKVEELYHVSGPCHNVEHEGLCIGVFTREDDSKFVGACRAETGTCPTKWSEADCVELRPVNASVASAPTISLW